MCVSIKAVRSCGSQRVKMKTGVPEWLQRQALTAVGGHHLSAAPRRSDQFRRCRVTTWQSDKWAFPRRVIETDVYLSTSYPTPVSVGGAVSALPEGFCLVGPAGTVGTPRQRGRAEEAGSSQRDAWEA